jgi:prepilin-type N-terminal cleavage/methylation domain-containing protein
MRVRVQQHDGVTLVELLVTLTLLGLMAGIAGLALHAAPALPMVEPVLARALAARDSAVRMGHPVSIALAPEGHVYHVTAFPDGRMLTDAPLPIDPLSGSVRNAAR